MDFYIRNDSPLCFSGKIVFTLNVLHVILTMSYEEKNAIDR